MTRFDKFISILAFVLPKVNLTVDELLDGMTLLYNPNVQNMINGDYSVPVEQKVREYIHYVAKTGPRPFWLTTGD